MQYQYGWHIHAKGKTGISRIAFRIKKASIIRGFFLYLYRSLE
jgi:hypothetical protein